MKILGTLLAVLLVALGAIAVIAPRRFEVSREVVIARPPEVVFGYLRFMSNLPKWNAWFKLDPAARFTYEGTDGEVGSLMTWASDERDVGSGTQRLSALEEGLRVETLVTFSEPFAGDFIAYNTLSSETDGRTKVVMGLRKDLEFPQHALSYVLNVLLGQQAKLTEMMDQSLKNLKWELESAPVP